MDPLVELPVQDWPKLQNLLHKSWPVNAPGFYALYLNMKYAKVKEAFRFQVYCPFGDMTSGFVATSIKGETECIIWPISEDTRKLEDALIKTRIIDWSQRICIDTVSSIVIRLLDRINPYMGFSLYYVGMLKTVFLDKSEKPYENLKFPSNICVQSVQTADIRQIDDCWPYKHADSHRYFSVFAENGLSTALYSTEDHTILAWVFLNEYNFLAHLYCLEKYRRRGYSQMLVQYVVNKELVRGNDVYAYVVDGNEKSTALFSKLGFSVIDDSCYLYVQK